MGGFIPKPCVVALCIWIYNDVEVCILYVHKYIYVQTCFRFAHTGWASQYDLYWCMTILIYVLLHTYGCIYVCIHFICAHIRWFSWYAFHHMHIHAHPAEFTVLSHLAIICRYVCCAGYLPCSGHCGERDCPEFCLCTEASTILSMLSWSWV
jgi:hypothetical protein